MIYKKLLEFQKLNIKVERDEVNPYYNSDYTTLSEIYNKVLPELNKLGVIMMHIPEKDGMRTVLYDTEDDTKVEGFIPYVDATTPQKLGSSITYNRRYGASPLLCLRELDDDGNEASGVLHQKQQQNVTTGQIGGTTSKRGASEAQKNLIKRLVIEKGQPEPDEDWYVNLSMTEARTTIDRLMKLPTVEQGDKIVSDYR